MVAADLAHRELHHEDETHLDTNPYLCRMWHRRGQQAVLPAAGTNRRLTTFGSVEVFGRGRVEVLCADQTSAGFQLYLEALDRRHAATGREITLTADRRRQRPGRGKSDGVEAEAIARELLAPPGLPHAFKGAEAGLPDPRREELAVLVRTRKQLVDRHRRLLNEAEALHR